MSFALVICILVPLFALDALAVRASVAASLVLLVVQGMMNHKRTDELIFGEHSLARASERLRETNRELEEARAGLEREVAARTERLRETNVALARANLELAELAQRRERMILEVSHDLRTPLTSVKGAAQNLLDGISGPLSEDQREYVEIVRDHSDRLITAVRKLLDAAREREVRVDLDAKPVDIGALSREVVRSLQPIADERGVRLEIRATEAKAVADGAKLRKVVENLVGNALKFTDRGGLVQLDVSLDSDEVRLTIADDGVGIEASDVEHVFDRFRRAREDRPGSGLGLAITRDLVRLHGGDVLVKSAPGKGSTFAVVLPRRVAACASGPAARASSSSTTILRFARSFAIASARSDMRSTSRRTGARRLRRSIPTTSTSCSSTCRCPRWTASRCSRRSAARRADRP
jgi:signal transduction histidine kinase